jgi:hypothetical protein
MTAGTMGWRPENVKKMSPGDMANLYATANAEGVKAATAMVPNPMIVQGYENDPIMDGVCGFAWVTIRPGTSRFAKWLVQNDLASKAYGGGVQIWIGAYNQSMQKKEAHARAMAKVFQAAGISATAGSRMD